MLGKILQGFGDEIFPYGVTEDRPPISWKIEMHVGCANFEMGTDKMLGLKSVPKIEKLASLTSPLFELRRVV